ncbi:MAG: hypothetical protein ACE5I3_07235 [Phycisphaerae bacterium]
MGYAYTPGLSVAESTVIRRVRRLPLKGEVLVRVGKRVKPDDVVAEAKLPGDVRPVNVVGMLGTAPDELLEVLLKQEGDPVAKNEPFARTRGFWGLFQSECRSPIDGTIESASPATGQVIIRGRPTVVRKLAYVAGEIVDVQEGESATVEVSGTLIQGIFGLAGEAVGTLEVVVDSPDAVLDADRIKPAHAAKVIVGGSLVTAGAVEAAVACGVKGIVSGGLNDTDVRATLGYELGVAITGEEALGVTVIITEGFGKIGMAKAAFELLQKRSGRLASINGATQIRAGVIRPEIIIPLDEKPSKQPVAADEGGVVQIGTRLRAIREPYFGRLGRCTALPAELETLSSEAQVRVLEVEFDDGARATLPRANVELIKA